LQGLQIAIPQFVSSPCGIGFAQNSSNGSDSLKRKRCDDAMLCASAGKQVSHECKRRTGVLILFSHARLFVV